jgi:predicted SAM-dependent methyltransferase
MKYLNLGCGSRFHPDWVNLDIISNNPCVQTHDLHNSTPYPDQTFDVVYHSHLLEHFHKHEALGFTQECYRVLKPDGVIRVVVPDLEQITRTYLQVLDKAREEQIDNDHNHRWIMLELYDQTVREYSGGEMKEYLKQNPIPNEGFVIERVGRKACNISHALRNESTKKQKITFHMRNLLHTFRRLPVIAQDKIIRMILGKEDYKALQVGRFRAMGEIHLWMYDRYSLAQLLNQAGFRNPVQRSATESTIPNWVQFNLDTEPDGLIYKPDSLFMEATKSSL